MESPSRDIPSPAPKFGATLFAATVLVPPSSSSLQAMSFLNDRAGERLKIGLQAVAFLRRDARLNLPEARNQRISSVRDFRASDSLGIRNFRTRMSKSHLMLTRVRLPDASPPSKIDSMVEKPGIFPEVMAMILFEKFLGFSYLDSISVTVMLMELESRKRPTEIRCIEASVY